MAHLKMGRRRTGCSKCRRREWTGRWCGPRDYERFAGSRIRVRGYGPLADRGRKLEGMLLGMVDGLPGTFALEIEGDRVEIPLELVASARLVYDWDAAGGVGGR